MTDPEMHAIENVMLLEVEEAELIAAEEKEQRWADSHEEMEYELN